MRGPDVRDLQVTLTRKGFPAQADGIYGPGTAARVVAAKRALHYPPSKQKNYAGPLFRRLLELLPDKARLLLPAVFVPTHETAGLPDFGAIDLFKPPGTLVGAPESGTMVYRHMIDWDQNRRVGGWTCYFHGDSGNTYFDTHFGQLYAERRYAQAEPVGTVGFVPGNWWAPHIHHGKHRGIYNP